MEFDAELFSQAFLSSDNTDAFSVQVSSNLWKRIVESENSGRAFLRIRTETEKEWIVPLGQPILENTIINTETETENLYLPLWMANASYMNACGEKVHVEVMNTDAFPEATKIILKVVDSAFYRADVKEQLESALTRIGIVRKHTTLEIPLDELDGFPVEVFVVSTEPADLVLCEGDEVAVEFEEPVDYYSPPPSPIPRPPTPIPPEMEFFENSFQTQFPGKGQILGSDPTITIPEWRRDLRPRSILK